MISEQFKCETSIIENFADLNISDNLKDALVKMKMIKMTPIQAKSIPSLLNGKDLMGAAKTGSGKTLAFLVPLVDKLIKENLGYNHGTAAIVLSPTRELSQQIFNVLNELLVNTKIKSILLIGGNNRKNEAKALSLGVTVIVATPGRLKDHINNTEHFLTHRLHTLVIDEADRLMDQGFYEDMCVIINKLPKKRQTVLFSATLNVNAKKLKSEIKNDRNNQLSKKTSTEDKVLSLASLSLKKTCVYVDISTEDIGGTENQLSTNEWTSTVSELSQTYVVTDPEDRFLLLFAFTEKYKNKKMIIFMSTNLEVKYYSVLLNSIGAKVLSLYGQLKQTERENNYQKFKDEPCATILCTDVAARGLDVPDVDLVVQFDPPRDHKEYLHRVGRTARAGRSGEAIIFLRPHEIGFLSVMTKHKIPIKEVEYVKEKLPKMQNKLEEFIYSEPELKLCAEAAFLSFVKGYHTYRLKCFNSGELDLQSLAKTFGLKEPPRVMMSVSMKKRKRPHNTNGDVYMPIKRRAE